MLVCKCVPNVRVYDFVMFQCVKVSSRRFCFWLWKCFVWKALCWLSICTHHFASSYLFLSKKNKTNKLILHEDSTYRQKKKKNVVLKIGCLQDGLTGKSLYVDSFPSFLPGTLAQALCVYTHSDFSSPAMKFWPHEQLWHRLWAGSDKSYLLSYVEVYIKLNGSGYLCQSGQKKKSKITNRTVTLTVSHLKPFT